MVNLNTIALALPEVERGVACAGTALESRTYQVKKKSFLFVSNEQARMKLDASASEARRLGFAVGANGWVTVSLDAPPKAAVMKRWIAESYSLVSRPAGKSRANPKGTHKGR
jgi:predicted DNA-binding protein (MmcQ/YjbR family)